MDVAPLISVIVPVYKVEPYLRECVDSIINQTYRNLEIILVDDGSPDNCGVICDEYAQKDSRVKVIHKENGGVSSARNAALEIAKGDYIGFVDSDDYIAEDMYEALIKGFEDESIGIVSTGIWEKRGNTIDEYRYLGQKWPEEVEKVDPKDAFARFVVYETLEPVLWNKLYRRELIKSLRFYDGRNNEDNFFFYELSKYLEQSGMWMVRIPERHYFYRRIADSISLSKKRPLCVDAYENLLEIIDESKVRYPEYNEHLNRKCLMKLLEVNARVLQHPQARAEYFDKYHKILVQHKLLDFGKGLVPKDRLIPIIYASVLKYFPNIYCMLKKIY